MPADRYRFAYADDSPYGRAVALLSAHTHVPGGVVVDVGCGHGAIAEPVSDLGLAYVGVDVEEAGLSDLAERGFETGVVDLADARRLGERLDGLVAGRPLAAICALDVLEHLTNGPAVLAVLRDLSVRHGRPPLVVSIPNVAHLDLAGKLLIGRWDVTPTGLLDETHVTLYAPHRLEATFEAGGWAEVGRADFELSHSDQHFPPDAPVLADGAPLRRLLADLRSRAAPGATTNQFVRAFVPVTPPGDAPEGGPFPASGGRPASGDVPFLSALVVYAGDDRRLGDTLVALDAQPAGDVEAVVCLPGGTGEDRSRVDDVVASFSFGLARRAAVVAVDVPPGPEGRGALLDAGVRAARGRYVTVLDDGAIPFAHHVHVLARLAAERPGAVVRGVGLSQELRALAWPGGRLGYEPAGGAVVASSPRFDLLDHLRGGGSPPGTYAIPRSCFADLGLSFACATPGLEDDEVLARAAMWCGVHDEPTTPVCLLRRLPPTAADGGDRARLVAALDADPLLLPPGSLRRLLDRRDPDAAAAAGNAGDPGERPAPDPLPDAAPPGPEDPTYDDLLRNLAAARAEVADLRASTSWRVTAPLRRLASRRRRRLTGGASH